MGWGGPAHGVLVYHLDGTGPSPSQRTPRLVRRYGPTGSPGPHPRRLPWRGVQGPDGTTFRRVGRHAVVLVDNATAKCHRLVTRTRRGAAWHNTRHTHCVALTAYINLSPPPLPPHLKRTHKHSNKRQVQATEICGWQVR